MKMGYFLVVLLVVALYHFICESILAPSMRLKLRVELFVLRDRVRSLKIESPESFKDRHFHYLQDSLNNLIALLARFDCATLARIEAEMKRHPEMRRHAEERSRTFDDCDLEDARVIRYESLKIASAALVVNSGGWLIYVIPPLAVVGAWFGLSGYVSSFQQRIKAVIAIPQSDIRKVAPEGAGLSLGLTG
jgi:hypothetical protein